MKINRKISHYYVLLLLRMHSLLYRVLSRNAVRIEGGLHPKHRLTKYHDFFFENIMPGDSVLDIGCGNGQVLRKIAAIDGARLTGVDISSSNTSAAEAHCQPYPNIRIACSDIWDYDCESHFDVVLLSNVLEHLKNRVELLQRIVGKFCPRLVLIRVPMYEREWLVPYKREMGVEWRLDDTHEIEYTENEIRQELADAGLEIQSISFRWGEMYIKSVPVK